MTHVFLSYVRQDSSYADMIQSQLHDAGFEVWLDETDSLLEHSWTEHVEDIECAIRDSFALIVLLTPAAHTSSQVMYAWTFALGVGVHVIPVLCQPTELHPRLDKLNCLKFTDAGSQPWGRLIGTLQEARSRHEAATVKTLAATNDKPPAPLARRERPSMPESPPPSFGANRPAGFLDRFRRAESPVVDAALNESNQVEAVPRLLRLLEEGDQETRVSAARRLADLHVRAAVPGLICLLRDDDWRLRDAGANALGKLKAAAAVPALLETLRQTRPTPFGRTPGSPAISWAIRQIGTAGVPVLIDALSDDDWRIRLEVVEALGDINDPAAVPALTSALADPEARVRWRAAEALGKMGDSTSVPALVEALRSGSEDLRITASWALGRLGHAGAVPSLVALLSSRDWRVRWSAAEALWQIGDAALPALLDALRHDSEYVRRAVIRILSEIGEAAFPGLLKSLSDADWDVRWAAAEALQEMGDAAVPFLIAALRENDWRAGWAAAEALKQIGTREALDAVEAWRRGLPTDEASDSSLPGE